MKMILKQVLKMLGVAWLSLSGFSAVAQTAPAAPLKTPANGNPLCPFLFTADPTVSLDPTLVKGKHDVYFYFPEGRAVMFDEWQFVENVSTAIQRPSWQNHGKAVPEMYDLNGRTLNGSLPQGVVIQRDPASGATRKVLVK